MAAFIEASWIADALDRLPVEMATFLSALLLAAVLFQFLIRPLWITLDRGRHERYVRRVLRRELNDSRFRFRRISTLRRKALHPPRDVLARALLSLDVVHSTDSSGQDTVRLRSR